MTIWTCIHEMAKYEPDPKTLCCLCKECFLPSYLITIPEGKNICIKCGKLLGEIAEKKQAEIKKGDIERMTEIIESRIGCSPKPLAGWLYDAGYRKVE